MFPLELRDATELVSVTCWPDIAKPDDMPDIGTSMSELRNWTASKSLKVVGNRSIVNKVDKETMTLLTMTPENGRVIYLFIFRESL